MNDSTITAFAFPGMGIRLTGFERALFFRHRKRMLPFLEEAGALAVADLVGALQSDSPKTLDDRDSQIFTLAYSAALNSVLADRTITARYLAGYSFGLYAALFASGALSFSQTLACACRAFDFMQEACPQGKWGMAAIVGMSRGEIEPILDGSITLVNINSDTCMILAGTIGELESLCCRALSAGAIKAEMLPAAIPYHAPNVLQNASEKLRAYLESLSWNEPKIPLVSSLDQTLVTEIKPLKDYIASHLSTPINWLNTVGCLKDLGVTRIVECGPGVSVSRHGGFMPYDIVYVNVKNMQRYFSL